MSLNSRQPAETNEIKIFEKFSKNLSKTAKIAEVFFMRLRFHSMRQSELKVRAKRQFRVAKHSKFLLVMSAMSLVMSFGASRQRPNLKKTRTSVFFKRVLNNVRKE